MAANGRVLPLLLAVAACALLLRGIVAPAGSEQSGFVNPQLRSTAAALAGKEGEGSAPAAAVVSAAGIAAAPGLAEAATEQELNRFGFIFALVFLGFFVAGLARLLTVGRL